MELCLYLFIGTHFGNSRVVLPNHLSIYTSDEFGNGVKIGKINPHHYHDHHQHHHQDGNHASIYLGTPGSIYVCNEYPTKYAE